MNTKTMKRLAILIAAVCVLMITAVPTYAANGDGWYNQGTPATYTNPITVKVVLQSRKNLTTSNYINEAYNVTLGTANMTATSFKVIDALVALNSQQSDYELLQSDGDYIEATDSVLYNVKKVSTGYIYGPALYDTNGNPLDGWMFKVNGKFPTSTNTDSNAQGLDVSHTYIADGDVIYFFTDYPWKVGNSVKSAYFISADTTYNSNTGNLHIQLMRNRDYYIGSGSSATWTIDDYEEFEPSTTYQAYVKDAAGNSVGFVNLSDGAGNLSCTLNSGTQYYVSVNTRDFHNITGLNANGTSITVGHLARTIEYDKVNH